MYIPLTMKKKIANVFYDKEVSILEKSTSMDAEGGVKVNSYDVTDTFKGNVNFSNCKQIQEEYGLDYLIDVAITTDTNVPIDSLIKYDEIIYNVTDVLKNDSHVLIVATKWQK